jgi:hypothetical protein
MKHNDPQEASKVQEGPESTHTTAFADDGPHRFMDVDLFNFLDDIVDEVIVDCTDDWNDWSIDKETLWSVAVSDNPEDRRLVLFAYPEYGTTKRGTNLTLEHDVFIKDSRAYDSITKHYQDTSENLKMFGYIIEVTERSGRTVTGNVFEIDNCAEYVKHVQDVALPLDSVTHVQGVAFNIVDYNAGKTIGLRYHSADETQLADLLQNEDAKRMLYPIGDTQEHQIKIAERIAKIHAEAEVSEPKNATADLKLGQKIIFRSIDDETTSVTGRLVNLGDKSLTLSTSLGPLTFLLDKGKIETVSAEPAQKHENTSKHPERAANIER